MLFLTLLHYRRSDKTHFPVAGKKRKGTLRAAASVVVRDYIATRYIPAGPPRRKKRIGESDRIGDRARDPSHVAVVVVAVETC